MFLIEMNKLKQEKNLQRKTKTSSKLESSFFWFQFIAPTCVTKYILKTLYQVFVIQLTRPNKNSFDRNNISEYVRNKKVMQRYFFLNIKCSGIHFPCLFFLEKKPANGNIAAFVCVSQQQTFFSSIFDGTRRSSKRQKSKRVYVCLFGPTGGF